MSLVETINSFCEQRLGRIPDWIEPKGYNDKIQWLKVHDQTELHAAVCDKLKAREIASERAGHEVLVPLLYRGPLKYVDQPHCLKTNHDSGSSRVVRNRAEYSMALSWIRKRLAQVYGQKKGEWGYAFVEPCVMAEALMPQPVVDYKFHCVHGRIKWVQVIRDRSSGRPKETILDAEGQLTSLHMDHKMKHVLTKRAYPGDAAWEALVKVALSLAAGWRYVRVDLYYVKEGPLSGVRFGELTLWPLSGCYRTEDEPVFGEMLDIDLSYKLPPIVQ